MSQFTLLWDNTKLLLNSNNINQRALYRYRLVGGAFISTGFSPSNDLATSVNTVDSGVLDNNKVVQFKITELCTASGPTDNDNGIQEGIEFEAITPTLTQTETTGTIVVPLASTDITKVRITLRKSSDNTIVSVNVVNNLANAATYVQTGLVGSTAFYWQIELFATVNNVEMVSSSTLYYGTIYSPYPFTTNAPSVCDPVTSVVVSSIEI